MATKKASGARRCAAVRLVKSLGFTVRAGKRGAPKGRADERLDNLRRDLGWIGDPYSSGAKIVRKLIKTAEFSATYRGINERTLRLDVAKVQREIWGPRPRGRIIGQQN
jgi:hypothetical protein